MWDHSVRFIFARIMKLHVLTRQSSRASALFALFFKTGCKFPVNGAFRFVLGAFTGKYYLCVQVTCRETNLRNSFINKVTPHVEEFYFR